MKIKHLIEQLVLEELEKYKYKIGGGSAIPAGPVKLYHISDTEGIKKLDPNAAAKKPNTYSTAGYKAWDQPRVFFFTKKGQKDGGIGMIPGKYVYVVELDRSELYDINNDDPNYFADWKGAKKRYIEITGKDSVNNFDLIKTLLEKDAPSVKGFLFRQGPKPEGEGKEEEERNKTIAALWEPVEPSGVITPEEYYEKQK
jgi:hypothetical protein